MSSEIADVIASRASVAGYQTDDAPTYLAKQKMVESSDVFVKSMKDSEGQETIITRTKTGLTKISIPARLVVQTQDHGFSIGDVTGASQNSYPRLFHCSPSGKTMSKPQGTSSYAIEATIEPKVSFENFRTGCSLATVEAAFDALRQVGSIDDFGSFELLSSAFECTPDEHKQSFVRGTKEPCTGRLFLAQ